MPRKQFSDLSRKGQYNRLRKHINAEHDTQQDFGYPQHSSSGYQAIRLSSSGYQESHQVTFGGSDRILLTQIQMTLSDLCESVRHLSNKIDALERRSTEGGEESNEEEEVFRSLPLSSMEAFENFKESLINGARKPFVKLLKSVGGDDIPQAINNMLRRVMVDELAMQFSYTGKLMAGKMKVAFGRTDVAECLMIAVQGLFGENATQSKIASLAAKWFQQAKTRVERRSKSHAVLGLGMALLNQDEEELHGETPA